MKSISNLKQMVMNGMLVQSEIDKFSQDGILKSDGKKLKSPVDIENWNFSPIITSSANKMSPVYIAFYCLENSVRDLIVDKLYEIHGANWWEKCVPDKTKKRVEQLKIKEQKNKYHSQRSTNNIGYTLFGDMASIIVANWSDFSDLLPNQAWITSRFEDLEMSRNIIMHSGVLPEDEIERIKTCVQDWIEQVG